MEGAGGWRAAGCTAAAGPHLSSPSSQHCAGVTALLAPTPTTLVTASRDGTVRTWQVGRAGAGAAPTPLAERVGHAAWVSALALPTPTILASASHDRTVRLWDARETGTGLRPRATLAGHADYVTCLASSPAAPLLSAGLGGAVLAWDLDRAGSSGVAAAAAAATPVRCVRGGASAYALALAPDAAHALVGGAGGFLRLVDIRSGAGADLAGHGDVVRAVAFSADGRRAVSASSDRTLRVWDVGTRRCMTVLAPHTDSVWGVVAGGGGSGDRTLRPASSSADAFATILSAGRDGCIYRTHAPTRTAELIGAFPSPLTCVAVAGGAAWAGTPSSGSVPGWRLPQSRPPPPGSPRAAVGSPPSLSALLGSPPAAPAGGALPPPGASFHVPSSPLVRAKQAFSGGGGGVVAPAAAPSPPPTSRLPGAPPLVAAEWLPDRRLFASLDAAGAASIWDAAACAPVETLPAGTRPADEVARRWRPDAGAPWASLDVALGAPRLTLDPGTAFGAEAYAAALPGAGRGGGAGDDAKINLGVELLRAALGPAYGPAVLAAADFGDDEMGVMAVPRSALPPLDAAAALVAADGADAAGTPFAAPVGTLAATDPVPPWAAGAAATGAPAGAGTKVAFILRPARGAATAGGAPLPPVLPPRLSAPRVLTLGKVAAHAAATLAAAGVACAVRPRLWEAGASADAAARADAAAAAAPGGPLPGLELTIAGAAAPHDLTLGGAKAWLWKGGADPVFEYRLLERGGAPAPGVGVERPPPG